MRVVFFTPLLYKKMKKMKKFTFFIIPLFVSITIFLIYLFLSGKIIDIPKGTEEGGLYGAIGVGIILIVVFALVFLTFKMIKKNSFT